MSYTTIIVSNSAKNAPRAEAVERSTSGLLIVFDPLWVNLPERGLLLHECGYLELCDNWNFASVFSPFWRLYWNSKPGFFIGFSGQTIGLTPDNLVLIPPHCAYDCWTKTPTQKSARRLARVARKRLREVGMNRGFMRKREKDEGLEGCV